MNREELLKIIRAYKTSEESIFRVYDIFIHDDTRYLNPIDGAIVAGFIDNNAISIEKKKIKEFPVRTEGIRGLQKEMKAFVINMLKKDGYKIVSIERAFRGLIPDVLARKGDEKIAVECGPCFITKAIEYLKEPKTCLWILKPENGDYSLFNVKRSASWDSFLKFHTGFQLDNQRKYVDRVWKHIEKTLPRILTNVELAGMFKAAERKERDLMLLKCMYFLGMRNNEVQTTKAEDIDTLNKTIRIVKDEKERQVPIPKGFFEELQVWVKNKSGYLFNGRSKGLISNRQIRRVVKKYAKIAKVHKYEEIHPHTLRHTYAVHLKNSGVPLSDIRVILGHIRMETTSIYGVLGTKTTKEYVDKAFSGF